MVGEIFGEDKPPYSRDALGAPQEMIDAVKQGFGLNVTEFDIRACTWLKENPVDTDTPVVV